MTGKEKGTRDTEGAYHSPLGAGGAWGGLRLTNSPNKTNRSAQGKRWNRRQTTSIGIHVTRRSQDTPSKGEAPVHAGRRDNHAPDTVSVYRAPPPRRPRAASSVTYTITQVGSKTDGHHQRATQLVRADASEIRRVLCAVATACRLYSHEPRLVELCTLAARVRFRLKRDHACPELAQQRDH